MRNDGDDASALGRRVWDSRGRSTLEADIVLKAGATAMNRALRGFDGQRQGDPDLRDADEQFGGYEVTRAAQYVKAEFARAVVGLDAAQSRFTGAFSPGRSRR